MRSSCRVLAYASLITFLLSSPGAAQEQAQDEKLWDRATLSLEPSPELNRQKREKAREGRWAWTLLGRAAAGFDTNIYQGPNNEQDSLTQDVGVKLDGLRYLDNGDRLSLSLKGSNARPFG